MANPWAYGVGCRYSPSEPQQSSFFLDKLHHYHCIPPNPSAVQTKPNVYYYFSQEPAPTISDKTLIDSVLIIIRTILYMRSENIKGN